MAEQLEPTATVTVTSYTVDELLLSRRRALIKAVIIESTGTRFACQLQGAVAITKIKQLNTANLSVKSLDKRVIEEFQAVGQLPAGAVTGTPDV